MGDEVEGGEVKRDMNLIRALLLEVEGLEEERSGAALAVRGYDSAQISYHVHLMVQAGLVEATDASTSEGNAYFVRCLTWEGHDLLAALRAPRIWQQVKDKAEQAGIHLTIEVAKELALSFIRSRVGL